MNTIEPKGRKRTMSVYFTDEFVEELRVLAESEHRSMSATIEFHMSKVIAERSNDD